MKATQRKTEARYGGKRLLMTSLEHLDPAVPEARYHGLLNYFSLTLKSLNGLFSHLLQTSSVGSICWVALLPLIIITLPLKSLFIAIGLSSTRQHWPNTVDGRSEAQKGREASWLIFPWILLTSFQFGEKEQFLIPRAPPPQGRGMQSDLMDSPSKVREDPDCITESW